MRNAILFAALIFAACDSVATPLPSAGSAARTSAVGGNIADAGTATGNQSSETSASSPLTAAANVTRHLPGTAITTATGKYIYLVQSDGAAAPFATSAIATASGYPTALIITVSAQELYCYGHGNQITAALPAPSPGKLRDGSLVKEKNKSDTYAVSDGVAWPIKNGTVFAEAGYDWNNVVEMAPGTLARSVDAVGDCAADVVCLDEAYLLTCAQDAIASGAPTSTLTSTATATSTATSVPPSATATSTGTATSAPNAGNQTPAANVTQHLPGTAITTATGKYVYLVQDDGTAAPFASVALAASSGYPAAMVVTVSSDELYCYGRGDQITVALPAPMAGKLRDGTLVKEKGKSDTYVVSDGVAWPIKNGTVFIEAGYAWGNVVELASGALAGSVSAVGDCVAGFACLDEAYLTSCSRDETVAPLATATATVTSTTTSITTTATQTASATGSTGGATATITATATATAAPTPVDAGSLPKADPLQPDASVGNDRQPTVSVTATATAAAIATQTPSSTATSTVTAISTGNSDASVEVRPLQQGASDQSPATVDLSWVYEADGADLCLNAAYFAGGDEAVLLIWSGPGADAAKGSVAYESGSRFCWDFADKDKGLYYFWADVPDPSCSALVCPRDAVDGNGAMYMTAPKATPAARHWLHCEPTGCDGAAYWDGSSFAPMGD